MADNIKVHLHHTPASLTFSTTLGVPYFMGRRATTRLRLQGNAGQCRAMQGSAGQCRAVQRKAAHEQGYHHTHSFALDQIYSIRNASAEAAWDSPYRCSTVVCGAHSPAQASAFSRDPPLRCAAGRGADKPVVGLRKGTCKYYVIDFWTLFAPPPPPL